MVPVYVGSSPTLPPKREVAQLVAHYVRDVGVGCSSHLFPTICRYSTMASAPACHAGDGSSILLTCSVIG